MILLQSLQNKYIKSKKYEEIDDKKSKDIISQEIKDKGEQKTIDKKQKSKNKKFHLFVYKDELNKIICYINNNNPNNKCYEIIYLSKLSQFLPDKLVLNDDIIVKDYDSFDSDRRRRFNIMNSPLQKKLYKKS